jgi:hypothetical protein
MIKENQPQPSAVFHASAIRSTWCARAAIFLSLVILLVVYRIGAGYFEHPTVWDARHVVGAIVKIVPLIIFQVYLLVFALRRFAFARQDSAKTNNLVALETLLLGVTNEAVREELQLRAIDAIETRAALVP